MIMMVMLMLQLYKAEEVALQRSSRNIGIEEFLFIMRRDKVCNSLVIILSLLISNK